MSRKNAPTAALTALALLAALFQSPAHAAPPQPAPPIGSTPAEQLERGRVCYFALDLACAERELSAAYTQRDALPPASRATLLALLAELHLAAERPDTARAHLVELLILQPTFSPSWPSAWLQTLDEARRLAPDKLPPTLSATLPQTARANAPLELSAEAYDPSGLARVELLVRRPEATPTEHRFALSTTDNARWTVTLPRELTAPGRLTVTLQAWDRHGNGPTVFPAADAHTIQCEAPPTTSTAAPPLTERWWFWATLVGVTGLAVALGFALAPDADTPDTSGDLGITLELP